MINISKHAENWEKTSFDKYFTRLLEIGSQK